MREEVSKRLERLVQTHGTDERNSSVQEVLSAVVNPVLEEFAGELCRRHIETSLEVEKGKTKMIVRNKNQEGCVLSFIALDRFIEISICDSFRGRVEAESMDSVLVEEHVLAFLSTVL